MSIPIALFGYNRPAHLKAVLEALRANELAAESRLYVFCDGPKDGHLTEAILAVRELVRGMSGFAAVEPVFREENLGCRLSIITGVSEVLNRHGRVIVVEDDIVTSPQFLRYMNDALLHYERDPHVFSVGAYSFPPATMPLPAGYAYDTYLAPRSCSWGWGVWEDRWRLVDWDMTYFEDFVCDPAKIAAFDRGGPDLSRMLADQYVGRSNTWDIQFCYAQFARNMLCVHPAQSFTRNIGLDNSGTHCGADPRREHATLALQSFPLRFCPGDAPDQRIFRSVYNVSSHYRRFPAVRQARLAVAAAWGKTRQMAKKIVFRPRPLSLLTINSVLDDESGKVAWRHFQGLSAKFPDAKFLTMHKTLDHPAVVGLGKLGGIIADKFAHRDQRMLQRYPAHKKDSFFTPGVRCSPVRIFPSGFKPEILHLNGITDGMLRLEELRDVQCPIVWTLPDVWPFTGGCHHVGDCRGFEGRCGHCGVLGSDKKYDLSYALMRRKLRLYPKLDLTLVAPCRWLANMARRSAVFALNRIEIIPHGLDLSVFSPVDHREAKAFFDVPADRPVVLCISSDAGDFHRGGDLIRAALSGISTPCTLLTLGDGRPELPDNPCIRSRSLGVLGDEQSLARAYSAADVFCCPAREGCFPPAVMEAMSCGVPCLAFNAGGLPEMIDHQQNGFLAQAYSPGDMSAGLDWLLQHPDPDQLREAARRKALAQFSLKLAVELYDRLFDELVDRRRHFDKGCEIS